MSAPDIKVKCSNCKYFIDSNAILGVCKRYPSYVNKHDSDWCGEYIWNLAEYKESLSNFLQENPDYATESPKKRGRPAKNA